MIKTHKELYGIVNEKGEVLSRTISKGQKLLVYSSKAFASLGMRALNPKDIKLNIRKIYGNNNDVVIPEKYIKKWSDQLIGNGYDAPESEQEWLKIMTEAVNDYFHFDEESQ